jgi:apolipoprotein N-acyltransferase
VSAGARGARSLPWPELALALGAGAVLPLAFAPFDLWPLAILCPAALMFLWDGRAPQGAATLGYFFGVGTFGTGTWWLFISIHGFGGAPIWLSVTLIVLLVAFMAGYYALLGWAAARALPAYGLWRWYLGLPALWLLLEWFRGWFLSGFPWLSLGYSTIDTALAGYAPVLGVYGLSAMLLLQAGALVACAHARGRARLAPLALIGLVWALGALLARFEWTRPAGQGVPVAILQGAIPQDEKWQLANREPTMALYRQLNDQTPGARLIVWPEAAIPELANEIAQYLAAIQASAHTRDADVVMGVVRLGDDGVDYYNSILALSSGVAFYDKRHLVPFAEYFPVPPFVRSWLRLMSLPYSDFASGSARQEPLAAGGLRLAPSICYEDAFGSAQLQLAARSDALVNVTNDAWFGHSPARYQHLQISRMRALEVGRFLLRAGNDGVSAIIGPRGELVAVAPEYRSAVLRGTVVPRGGLSPYTRVGNWPVVLLAMSAGAVASYRRRAARSAGTKL